MNEIIKSKLIKLLNEGNHGNLLNFVSDLIADKNAASLAAKQELISEKQNRLVELERDKVSIAGELVALTENTPNEGGISDNPIVQP